MKISIIICKLQQLSLSFNIQAFRNWKAVARSCLERVPQGPEGNRQTGKQPNQPQGPLQPLLEQHHVKKCASAKGKHYLWSDVSVLVIKKRRKETFASYWVPINIPGYRTAL